MVSTQSFLMRNRGKPTSTYYHDHSNHNDRSETALGQTKASFLSSGRASIGWILRVVVATIVTRIWTLLWSGGLRWVLCKHKEGQEGVEQEGSQHDG
jgi:hypothetical protein